MRSIGEKCSWVISPREERVLKLLREHKRERDHAFVAKISSSLPPKPGRRIAVTFALERLSAFEPRVRIVSNERRVRPRGLKERPGMDRL